MNPVRAFVRAGQPAVWPRKGTSWSVTSGIERKRTLHEKKFAAPEGKCRYGPVRRAGHHAHVSGPPYAAGKSGRAESQRPGQVPAALSGGMSAAGISRPSEGGLERAGPGPRSRFPGQNCPAWRSGPRSSRPGGRKIPHPAWRPGPRCPLPGGGGPSLLPAWRPGSDAPGWRTGQLDQPRSLLPGPFGLDGQATVPDPLPAVRPGLISPGLAAGSVRFRPGGRCRSFRPGGRG
jgi:hypothetical protein